MSNGMKPESSVQNWVCNRPGHCQPAIAETLTELDEDLPALDQRREKTRAFKQAMMQELLTGKTRLV